MRSSAPAELPFTGGETLLFPGEQAESPATQAPCFNLPAALPAPLRGAAGPGRTHTCPHCVRTGWCSTSRQMEQSKDDGGRGSAAPPGPRGGWGAPAAASLRSAEPMAAACPLAPPHRPGHSGLARPCSVLRLKPEPCRPPRSLPPALQGPAALCAPPSWGRTRPCCLLPVLPKALLLPALPLSYLGGDTCTR